MTQSRIPGWLPLLIIFPLALLVYIPYMAALGMLVTYSYNLIALVEPLPFIGTTIALDRGISTWVISLINVGLFVGLGSMVLRIDFRSLHESLWKHSSRPTDAA